MCNLKTQIFTAGNCSPPGRTFIEAQLKMFFNVIFLHPKYVSAGRFPFMCHFTTCNIPRHSAGVSEWAGSRSQ